MGGNKSHKHIKQELLLDDLAGKVNKDSGISQSEKALVSVDSGTLYFPILLDGTVVGGVFLGSGQFIIDAIVETRQGAIGKSEEHKWDGSLLLLNQGSVWAEPGTEPFKDADLKIHNMESAEEAKEKAQRILDRLTCKGKSWTLDCCDSKREGWVVNIANKDNTESRLVANRDRLVMTHRGTKLVIKGNKLVRKERKKTLVVGEKGNIVRLG